MMELSQLKISDVAKIVGTSLPLISRHFKDYDEGKVSRINNRVVGISPEAIEEYLKETEFSSFYRPGIVLSANICGGVGKTTSVISVAAAARRITGRDKPIVLVDGDPQGSLTENVFGKAAADGEPLLIDFLEGKVSIKELLTEIGDNFWCVKANLNLSAINRLLSKPQDIKRAMLKFYQGVFDTLGSQVKIFQDHSPDLSTIFASSVCALSQLGGDIARAVIIPIRSDKRALSGAKLILKEISDLSETFSFSEQNPIDIHCFFSNIDKRITTTGATIMAAKKEEAVLRSLSPVAIRFSMEVPRTIMNKTTLYSNGKNKKNHAGDDYQDLLLHVFCQRTESDS